MCSMSTMAILCCNSVMACHDNYAAVGCVLQDTSAFCPGLFL